MLISFAISSEVLPVRPDAQMQSKTLNSNFVASIDSAALMLVSGSVFR